MPRRDTSPISKAGTPRRNAGFARYVQDIVRRTMRTVTKTKDHVFPYTPSKYDGLGIRWLK